ncbi:MAG: ATP-dependent DNA ligase [Verrucomicrobiaceae bacterium]
MGLNFEVKGLHLADIGLRFDASRPVPWGFVSHGHADHFARHERILCSEGTGHLLRKRYGVAAERVETLRWEEPLEVEGHVIRLFPAGHIAGSAMIHVEKEGESLLYTGDFKMRESLTAERSVFPRADILVMETTFGRPQFVFPPTAQTRGEIVDFAREAIEDGETPVLLAYSLGKAQEAYAMLSAAAIPVVMPKAVYEMTEAVREIGWDQLPVPTLMGKSVPKGVAVIAPPSAVRSTVLRKLKGRRTAMLSGWALTPGARYRYQVDCVFPLSDHADFPGLLEAVARVKPKTIYTLHGSTREFAAELRVRGYDAWSIYGDDQLELLGEPVRDAKGSDRINPRPGCELRDLSKLLEEVAGTASRLKKVELLGEFLRGRDDETLGRLTRWLSGDGVSQTGGALIRQALLDASGKPLASYKMISVQQNDSARTARVLLEDVVLEPRGYSFDEVAEEMGRLEEAKGSLEKTGILAEWLRHLHPQEGETVVRLLTGGLRAGAREGIFEEAVAAAFGVGVSEVRHVAMLTGDLGRTAVLARRGELGEAHLQVGAPIKPMLASPTGDVEELLGWHQGLGGDGPLWLEPKYDGIRAQLHVGEDGAHLFSRDQRLLDEEFPEVIEAAKVLPECILDGELIAYAEGRKLTFFDLQKRLGRKKVQGDLFLGASIPVRFIAFDCLHAGGRRNLYEASLGDRRAVLESLGLRSPFSVIEVSRLTGPGEIEAAFKEAIQGGEEGLIAKDPEAGYQPGRRGKAWRKLKGVMPTLDCVVVAAQQGHGKRAGVLSDYTFAVRDEESGELRILGKAYSGLTDVEIEELTEHFERTTIERLSSRVRKVEPTIVLEIAFDRVRPSKRHDSGLALRFPRIKGIRRDKTPAEIDTLRTALRLVS